MYRTAEDLRPNTPPLSNEFKRILERAGRKASSSKHRYIGTGHLMLTILEHHGLNPYVRDLGIEIKNFRKRVVNAALDFEEWIGRGHGEASPVNSHTGRVQSIIEAAQEDARMRGSNSTETHHIVRRLAMDTEGYHIRLFETLGIDPQELLKVINKAHSPTFFQRIGTVFGKKPNF